MNFNKMSKFCMVCVVSLLLLILLNVIFGSSSPIPYYPDNIFAKQFPYTREGMDVATKNNDEDEEKEEGYSEEKEEEKEEKEKENNSSKKDTTKNTTNKKTDKENFQGLQSGSFNEQQYMGYLANVKTGTDCGSTSNGYSTSTGYICLNPEELRYLQSRGGNATSKGDF